MSYTREKQIALTAVAMAAELCTAVRAELVELNPLEKGDRSPVTIADFGAQALVGQYLSEAAPDDALVAEEDSTELGQAGHEDTLARVTNYVRRFRPEADPAEVCRWIDAGNGQATGRYWTLDPIDGTKGFLRNDQYAIALALVENGRVQVGALACPALPLKLADPGSPVGVVFIAVRGEGAMMAALGEETFEPIHVARQSDQAGLRFAESVEAAHGDHALQEAIAQAAGITQPPVRVDSQAKYGLVARGEAALYLRLPSPKSPDYREKIWDHAAGALIVAEAGGQVTDMAGRPLDFAAGPRLVNNRGVVASNGLIHRAVLDALARANGG